MKNTLKKANPLRGLFFLLFLILINTACASGPGGTENSTGSAALSLQLEELPAGGTYRTQDEFILDLTTFALSFSALTMGSNSLEEPFSADIFDEEVFDIIEIEEIPPGEYSDFSFHLALAEGLQGPSVVRFLATKNAVANAEVTSSLDGLSVLILADVRSPDGTQTCTLRVELDTVGAVEVLNEEDNHVEVMAGAEAEILVAVSPDALFGNIALGGRCGGGQNILVSAEENSDLAGQIEANLQGAFDLEGSEGHGHGHG